MRALSCSKFLFALLVIFPVYSHVFAQLSEEDKAEIKQIQQRIIEAQHDTILIEQINQWSDIIYLSDPDQEYTNNLRIDSICDANLKKNISEKERKFFIREKAFAYNNMGLYFGDQGNHSKAIECYMKSLRIKEENGMEKLVASTLNNIGLMYQLQGDIEKAEEFYLKSLELDRKLNDIKGIASSLLSLGNIYRFKENYEKGIEYYERSLEIFKELKMRRDEANAISNIGSCYYLLEDYQQSIEFAKKGLEIRKEINDVLNLSSSYNNMGVAYRMVGQYEKAVEFSKKALELAQKINNMTGIRNAAHALDTVYKKMGRYKEGLEMYELYISMRDSIKSEENQKEIIRQEYKYQYEKQALQDSVKNAEAEKIKDAELAAEKAEGKRLEIQNKQQQQQKYFLFGGLALALVFGGFIFNRFRVTRKQKGIIEEQKEKVDEAYEELGEKNQEILDSINYAKRIQSAILPPQKLVKSYLEQSFILYKPKDIVAGDFYWMETVASTQLSETSEARNKLVTGHRSLATILFAAADCTGHGVPGAMVSVVCNNGLNRAVREYGLTDPGKILDKTREIVIKEFEKSEEEVKDGMDIALVALQNEKQNESNGPHSSHSFSLCFSGAHNPLWIIRKGAEEVEEIKADKQPIGKFDASKPFTTHHIELYTGDTFYIFSDGFADQFGGEKGKKFKAANFKNLLLSVQKESMDEQRELIDQAFEEWKGNLEQLDDVCVIGVRV